MIPIIQALEAIPKLREAISLERAKMRIRVSMPSHEAKITHSRLKALFSELEMEDWAEGGLEMVSSGLLNVRPRTRCFGFRCSLF